MDNSAKGAVVRLVRLWTTTLWLYVMLAIGMSILVALILHRESWSISQRIAACVFIVLPLHAWEEWRIPGGFGWQYNWVIGKSDTPSRYPMDRFTDMITVFLAQCVGVVVLVLGAGNGALLSFTVFSALEVGMHIVFGIQMLRKFRSQGKRSIYNPGFATAICGFLPLLVAGTVALTAAGVSIGDLAAAVGVLALLVIVTFGPERIINRRDPAFAFAPGYFGKYVSV